MFVSTNISPPGVAEFGLDSAFSVVVAYEDFESGKHAQKTCNFLMEHLDTGCRFINQMWKFEALAVPSLREMAAKDAAMADVVVISCHGNTDLSIDVKAWIELWLGHQGAASALVCLFDRPDECADRIRSIRDYLASVAMRGEMEFFAQPDVWPGHASGLTDHDSASRKVHLESPVQVAAVSTKNNIVGHWGLNE